MHVEAFFDTKTSTLSYIVHSPDQKECVIIDPVWNFDYAAAKLSLESVDKLRQYIDQHKLSPIYILETHVHADHISAAHELKSYYPTAKIVINHNIRIVQEVFSSIFHLSDFKCEGQQFDLLVQDEQVLIFGSTKIRVLATPGHTPACTSYLIEDCLFTGDALFMPDFGTGRCDFPNGSAEDLYHSVQNHIYTLPDETKIYVGHDYMPGGRELKFQTSVKESKRTNKHIKEETTLEEFVNFRTTRDKELSAPTLLLPSIQINMNGGILPKSETNGISYLKIPLA